MLNQGLLHHYAHRNDSNTTLFPSLLSGKYTLTWKL